MSIMVSETHTMTLRKSTKLKESNLKHNFFSKTKQKLTFFAVIVTKYVEIVFNQTIDNIKEVNWKCVTP